MKSSLIGILQREKHPKVTFGKWRFPWNHPNLDNIELSWLNNEPKISCIPAGIYTLIPFKSSKHGDTWKFQNVPNRFDIEIHPANYACDVIVDGECHASELLGCLAPGFSRKESVPMVESSKQAMDYIRHLVGIKTTWQVDVRDPK